MCPPPQDENDARDGQDDSEEEQSGGQVSETTAMTPGAGSDSTPGTDDGVPPADEGHQEPGGPPGSYGD